MTVQSNTCVFPKAHPRLLLLFIRSGKCLQNFIVRFGRLYRCDESTTKFGRMQNVYLGDVLFFLVSFWIHAPGFQE